MPLLRGHGIQPHCLAIVVRNAIASAVIETAEVELRVGVTLGRGDLILLRRLAVFPRTRDFGL